MTIVFTTATAYAYMYSYGHVVCSGISVPSLATTTQLFVIVLGGLRTFFCGLCLEKKPDEGVEPAKLALVRNMHKPLHDASCEADGL